MTGFVPQMPYGRDYTPAPAHLGGGQDLAEMVVGRIGWVSAAPSERASRTVRLGEAAEKG